MIEVPMPRQRPEDRSEEPQMQENPGYDSEIVARLDPPEANASIDVTREEVHIYTENEHCFVSIEECETIRAVLLAVRDAQDRDDVVHNLTTFTGMMKFLASVGENEFTNPDPGRSDIRVSDDGDVECDDED